MLKCEHGTVTVLKQQLAAHLAEVHVTGFIIRDLANARIVNGESAEVDTQLGLEQVDPPGWVSSNDLEVCGSLLNGPHVGRGIGGSHHHLDKLGVPLPTL